MSGLQPENMQSWKSAEGRRDAAGVLSEIELQHLLMLLSGTTDNAFV